VMLGAGMRPYFAIRRSAVVVFREFREHAVLRYVHEGTFLAQYGRQMALIVSEHADPANFPDECIFLPLVIGQFTTAVMAFVRLELPYDAIRSAVSSGCERYGSERRDQFSTRALDCRESGLSSRPRNFTYTAIVIWTKRGHRSGCPCSSDFRGRRAVI